jgi:hypothetical protein
MVGEVSTGCSRLTGRAGRVPSELGMRSVQSAMSCLLTPQCGQEWDATQPCGGVLNRLIGPPSVDGQMRAATWRVYWCRSG